MINSQPFHGRIALVTGASRGIGRAAALQLARLGAGVALLARTEDDIAQAAGAIRSAGGRALAVRADIGRPDEARAAAGQVAGGLGPVDILINNAALMPLGLLASGDRAEWREALEVNVLGAYELMRAVLPGMLARGWGRIVNVSTKAISVTNLTHRSAYVASKAALDRLSLAAAAELAGSGVTVNVVYPGVTDTPMQAQLRQAAPGLLSDREQAMWRERHARGELHPPDEPARLIAAVALSDLHGAIVDLEDEQGQALLRGYPLS